MFIKDVIVTSNSLISENTYILEVKSDVLTESLKPGNFFNIKVGESSYPFLRRPFSIADVKENSIFFMYKVVGEGTAILADKKRDDKINLLGPLGNNFTVGANIDHLIILGGGIGIAPFPFLIKTLHPKLNYSVLFGVRTSREVHSYGLHNIIYSSDDGSIGFQGNVVQLLENHLNNLGNLKIKIIACGPNPMLRALRELSISRNISCEVSMESVMACGFGICQGCPIEYSDDKSYKLICKDGPVFNIKDIEI